MIQNKKAFLQISFAWLFAIIVGAFILFLAIYAVTKIMSTEETISDVKTAKEMGILLNPLETGFETGKTNELTFPVETRIYNNCDNTGIFGKQRIKISQKSFDKWTETDIDVGFTNKYLFSEEQIEGKKFYLFSKPLFLPFKITDLIYVTSSSENYCFIDAPGDIEEEISSLGQANLFVEDCPELGTEVCFGMTKCDINVDYGSEIVKKDGEVLHFEGDALMFAAIFSDSKIYDCQLQRTMKRLKELSQIYRDKEIFVTRVCKSDLATELIRLSNLAGDLSTSANLNPIADLASEIEEKNDLNSKCKLW